ncbi:MAG: hypothetical protein A07HR67_01528 [uncultured archaeon A07HR67]|nr:MAG: hypothetical protein A07HR67_01528 [uncultured archaeon A07HR67]
MTAGARTPPVRVSGLRALSILLAFTAAVGLVFGTVGFTAMDGDRGVAVSVADDKNAYVGFTTTTSTETVNNSTTAVVEAEYQNQFSQEIGLDVTVTVDGTEKNSTDGDVPVGGTVHITAEESCSGGSVTFIFAATATAVGDGSAIDLRDRTVVVAC